jgi:hypothetical protein
MLLKLRGKSFNPAKGMNPGEDVRPRQQDLAKSAGSGVTEDSPGISNKQITNA